MTDIKKFISELFFARISHFDYNIGSGSGAGFSSGNGDIYGFGSSDDYGFGSSDGCGDGCGCGFGDIDGEGFGDSCGAHIKSINGFPVYLIDGIPTGIISAKGNVAKGFILRKDFTMNLCYIVKDNNGICAHGKTLKKAQEVLRDKQFRIVLIEERIQLFKEHFESDKLYKGQEFYEWHHILTGSCKTGRDSFCRQHGIYLKAEYTVKDFIELTENSYGGDIIKKLRRIYEQ